MESVIFIKKILTGIGTAVLVFLAVFVYSFMGSKISDSDPSPQAYGYDSLAYAAEPVMKIYVWQIGEQTSRGDFLKSDHSIAELPTDGSASANNVYNLAKIGLDSSHTTIQIDYDGEIKGNYQYSYADAVYYMKTDDYAPWGYFAFENKDILNNGDGTFAGNHSVTINVDDSCAWLAADKELKSAEKNYAADIISFREETGNFKYEDIYRMQKITEVYDHVPDEIKHFERVMLTTHLYVNAMHPTKPETAVASADIEITSYSEWINFHAASQKERELFTESGLTNTPYSTVTVVSYEQSDSFSME